jgi:predicted acyltransferase
LNTSPAPEPGRLRSLDQFRGYTVLGMFLVKFIGSFTAIKQFLPVLSHHHTYCSYADTIMPHFLFAVGFSFRLTYLRRRERFGHWDAIWHANKRNFALLVVAFFVHQLDGKYESWSQFWETFQDKGALEFLRSAFERNFFQTLAHIAVTSLWILPVIGAGPLVRLGFMIFSGVLFHYLSVRFYYQWEMTRPGIDGGPLGFMGWAIPAILGSFAYDWGISNRSSALWKLVAYGWVVMLLAYSVSCLNLVSPPNEPPPAGAPLTSYLVEPPFIPPSRSVNIWTMSQRAGSISYVAFGAGFSLVVYALFLFVCDFEKVEIGLLRTLGVNALAGYILHDLVNGAIKPFTPKDSPLWWIFTTFGLSLFICYVCLRHLEKHKIYLRL